MPASASSWVQPPKQSRSQRTLDSLLDAAQHLLESRPFHALKVSEVVARAGSSSGSFYARFSDKRALLHALHERMAARARQNAKRLLDPAHWGGASASEIVHAFVASHLALHRLNRGVLRAALMESLHDPRFAQRALALGRDVRSLLVALLETRANEIGVADLDGAVDFAMRLVVGVLDQRLFLEGIAAEGEEPSDDELARRLGAVFCACLELRKGSAS